MNEACGDFLTGDDQEATHGHASEIERAEIAEIFYRFAGVVISDGETVETAAAGT